MNTELQGLIAKEMELWCRGLGSGADVPSQYASVAVAAIRKAVAQSPGLLEELGLERVGGEWRDAGWSSINGSQWKLTVKVASMKKPTWPAFRVRPS